MRGSRPDDNYAYSRRRSPPYYRYPPPHYNYRDYPPEDPYYDAPYEEINYRERENYYYERDSQTRPYTWTGDYQRGRPGIYKR